MKVEDNTKLIPLTKDTVVYFPFNSNTIYCNSPYEFEVGDYLALERANPTMSHIKPSEVLEDLLYMYGTRHLLIQEIHYNIGYTGLKGKFKRLANKINNKWYNEPIEGFTVKVIEFDEKEK